MTWHIAILSRDGQRVIFAAVCDDLKLVQGLATEARHHSLGYQIWIRPPIGRAYSWD